VVGDINLLCGVRPAVTKALSLSVQVNNDEYPLWKMEAPFDGMENGSIGNCLIKSISSWFYPIKPSHFFFSQAMVGFYSLG